MARAGRAGAAIVALLLAASPARAECIGDGCYGGLLWLLVGVSVYALAFVAGVAMVVFRKTRRAGLVLLAVLTAVGTLGLLALNLS